ncbi:Dolichyl-phosphate-mannose-protein mannosyltransferase [Streptomyces sp. 3213]|uniref:ArnT family glycosyltransferase n=1 Tax=Streptomyces sp. 3213.3 TaxID=1855348 RepID=UPI00089C22B8|nr:glycosyltransferase family 39 protein [Streptomyces sp. 3213.3]SED40937.1 Dolichyl-phosphate-mannose-protein mannosyltransferase [Streptomyces sp. 3213] [Streptomyces sp. 3213.3]
MTAISAARPTGAHRGRRAANRRSGPPEDAPRWERPALAAVLAVATVLYSWGMGNAALHPFYGAAIRSMTGGWRAFFFGGLDTSGSISIDKLPGAFWPDAASVWLFGPHTWAAALPQVVEGVLTVWLLHRIVRAWAGPFAALIAALTLTLTPVVVVLNRATIPDTALTLLLVAAAGALQKAVRTERLLPLITCGIWIGLAFQAKMLQAWLVLPVFAAVYQIAAPGTPLKRALRFLLGGAVALAVSCFWVLIAWATPAADRPYLDGTSDNNPFALVFGYNGLSRFSSDSTAFGAVAGTANSRTTGNTGWNMLINDTVGPQVSWFLPLAVLAAVLGVVWRTGQPRTDMQRAGFLLWGGWLAVHALVFSASNGNHAYYMAVIAPALAALTGGGLTLFRSEYESAYKPEAEPEHEPEAEPEYKPEHEPAPWSPYMSAHEAEPWSAQVSTRESKDGSKEGAKDRSGGRRHMALPAAIVLTVVWALVLDWPTRFVSWLLPIAVMLALCGVVGLWSRGPRTSPRKVQGALAAGIAATLVVPAGWAVSSLDPVYAGASTAPIAGPVGNAYYAGVRAHHPPRRIGLDRPSARDIALLDYLTTHRHGEKYLLATQTAYGAEPLLRAKSEPILVMGGFTGNTPFPTARQLGSLVTTHQVRYALLTTQRPATSTTTWVKSHCTRIPPTAYGSRTGGSFTLYDCNRS